MSSDEQLVIIYAGVRGYLDKLKTSEIAKFEKEFLVHMKTNHGDIMDAIRTSGKLTEEQDEKIGGILEEWIPQAGLAMK